MFSLLNLNTFWLAGKPLKIPSTSTIVRSTRLISPPQNESTTCQKLRIMHRDTLKLLLLKIYKIRSMHCENSPTGRSMYFTFQQHYLPQEVRFWQRANSSKTSKANCRDLFCVIFAILFFPPLFCALLSKLPFSTFF